MNLRKEFPRGMRVTLGAENINPSRTDITAWADLQGLEEGRYVPRQEAVTLREPPGVPEGSDMYREWISALFFVTGLVLAGCETIASDVIKKNAQSDELRKETTVGVTLPAGCPTPTKTIPAGKSTVTISYREPTTDQNGAPLKYLAYTTIYIAPAKDQPKAIRVWTNDPHGGALVTIYDVPTLSQEIGLCVTATNWARKESAPAAPSTNRTSR